MIINEILEKLPKHLMSLAIDQPYNDYTAEDHAIWRYVMRQNIKYLSRVAHSSYLEGLEKTGVNVDSIPQMYGMNRILKEMGWAAVAVDGFIPPAAFMEFQAYKVLVIAADIRPMNQIEYTPAPDIIHEAAGHAPIIADPDYSEYLRLFGAIGSKAFSSAKDFETYEAIRHLSILKANPYTPALDIENAEKSLAALEKNIGEPSEMALIRNLHWWTVEYGLIGDLNKPKIYGAGLLSSIGESFSCLKDDVDKLLYNIDAVNFGFDITTRQPQLFVTPNFETLINVLNQFADRMALRRGGMYGITKAIQSENTATLQFSSGLQVSGTFTEVIQSCDKPAYIKATGPTQLAFNDEEMEGHGKSYHKDGFGSPIGKSKDSETPLELLSNSELEEMGIIEGRESSITFESGVVVKGTLDRIYRKKHKNILIKFSNCIVRFQDKVLFQPQWGNYDMAIGQCIVSAFSGPADPDAFELTYKIPEEKTHKIHHTESAKKLHALYQSVRDIRDIRIRTKTLPGIWEQLKQDFPDDWLLPMEILELLEKSGLDQEMRTEIQQYLIKKQEQNPELVNLISNGLSLIEA